MALWRVLDYTSATLCVAVKHPQNGNKKALGGEDDVSHCDATNISLLRRSPAVLRQSYVLRTLAFLYSHSRASTVANIKKAILRICKIAFRWRRRRDSNS